MGCFDFYFRRFCCRVCYRVFLGVGLVTLYLDFLGVGGGCCWGVDFSKEYFSKSKSVPQS